MRMVLPFLDEPEDGHSERIEDYVTHAPAPIGIREHGDCVAGELRVLTAIVIGDPDRERAAVLAAGEGFKQQGVDIAVGGDAHVMPFLSQVVLTIGIIRLFDSQVGGVRQFTKSSQKYGGCGVCRTPWGRAGRQVYNEDVP